MSFTDPIKAKTYLNGYFSGEVTSNALQLVYKIHNGTRKDGSTPEWFHQISILMYFMTLEELFKDTNIFVGDLYVTALLHDIYEDYGYSLSIIADDFHPNVATAVELLSKKTPNGPKKSTAHYYSAIADNPLASLVKGADRIHNVQTMNGAFTAEKHKAYAA